MPDLPELLEAEARRLQPTTRPPYEVLLRARRARDRRGRAAAGALLVAVVAGAALVPTIVSGRRSAPPVVGSTAGPTATATATGDPTAPAGTVTARLTLAATSLPAGGSVRGTITVDNALGREIEVAGCGSLYSVLLAGPGYRPSPAWLTCLETLTIAEGVSTYPVTVRATYASCGTPARADSPQCLPGGAIPDLPPGPYAATTWGVSPDLPVPDPVPVTVTP